MSDYTKGEEEKYLIYYDGNNLNGWAMIQTLPTGNFWWVKNVEKHDFFLIPDDCTFGYILEVDLQYPEDIHDAHKNLPLCAEHVAVPDSKQRKLMTTLHHKQRYINYRALSQASVETCSRFEKSA